MAMKRPALFGLGIVLLVAIPVLFVLSGSSISTTRFIVIAGGVLLFVLWTAVYALLVDPLLRTWTGAVFGVRIEWHGPSRSIAWTPVESRGFLRDMLIEVLGYVFITLWTVPFASAVFLVYWLR